MKSMYEKIGTNSFLNLMQVGKKKGTISCGKRENEQVFFRGGYCRSKNLQNREFQHYTSGEYEPVIFLTIQKSSCQVSGPPKLVLVQFHRIH